MLFVDGAHQRRGRWQDLINEDKDGLLWRKLNALADDIDELTDSQVGGHQILLLIDGSDIGLFNFLADHL